MKQERLDEIASVSVPVPKQLTNGVVAAMEFCKKSFLYSSDWSRPKLSWKPFSQRLTQEIYNDIIVRPDPPYLDPSEFYKFLTRAIDSKPFVRPPIVG